MDGSIDRRVADMAEQVALPRKNGELVFGAPWEARAFGIAVALNERGRYDWHDFSQGLALEIAAAEQEGRASSYYERWLASLEGLLIAKGLLTRDELEARTAEYAAGTGHGEEDEHHHHAHP